MLTLSACEGGQGFSFGGSTGAPDKPLRQTALAGGAVQVVPPQGYCIDLDFWFWMNPRWVWTLKVEVRFGSC